MLAWLTTASPSSTMPSTGMEPPSRTTTRSPSRTSESCLLYTSWLGYSENDGAPALREAVSGLYTQCGPENVLLHVGAQEAIFGALNVLVEPGEHVICQFPTYQSLYEVARAAGCELSLWPLHQGKDGWYCDLDELERLITPKTRLLVLNTPNNPTGYALSADERQRICELARRHGLRILADEV